MDRCSLCTGNRIVRPVGPKDARILLCGEGPGKNEDKEGVPFVGVSGREQDHTYFGLAGISRRDVFITNCIICRCERGGVDVRPSAALVSACAENHLRDEILSVQPQIIILCGATASSLVQTDLEFQHGFPFFYSGSALWGWNGWVVPMYHPAAGLREPPRYMTLLLKDWENFGKWLRGEWEPPSIDDYQTDYKLVRGSRELRVAFGDFVHHDETGWPAIDTENDEDGNLYCIQVSTRPGHGLMVLVKDTAAMSDLKYYVNHEIDGAIMHNAVWDLDEMSTVGLHPPQFRDTMQELYHLGGILPQGLKPAIYRIFGFRMTSYDDVVTPASRAKLDDWLAEALAFSSQSMLHSTQHTKGKGCKACGKNHRLDKIEYKPHESEAVLRRVMGKLGEEGSSYDPWKPPVYAKGEVKLRLVGRDWLGSIEREIGRMPRSSIVHAPLDRQIQYACGDADWTGQLATWLEGERDRIVKEEWRIS